MSETKRVKQSTSLFRVILKLLLRDPSVLLDLLFGIYHRIPFLPSLPGMYEVLNYETELELIDSKGQIAIFTKHQQVRFLQNNVIAFQDQAWGDGEIFVNYQCSPGKAVDRYRDGHRFYILISLRETKHSGDETTFTIQRTIRGGFIQSTELFQTDIDHRTHKLSLSVVFPANRLPIKVSVLERNSKQSSVLSQDNRRILADGRHRYLWEMKQPRLYEAYILQWEW